MTARETMAPACWDAEDAMSVLRTEALGGSAAIFLATHTPIQDFSVTGTESATVAASTEIGVLDSLAAPGRRHAFAVVRGEPGSGKSHLIRWLSVEWPRENEKDIPLLLQRASANLEGSLRELKAKTPPEYASIIGDLGVRQAKTFEGKLADFTSKLANSLRPDYLEKPLDDVGFCKTHSPAHILANPDVQREWPAPRRVMGIMTNEDGKRHSETAAFSPYEMTGLVRFKARIAWPAAEQLLGRIERETDTLERLEDEGWSPEEVVKQHANSVPFAVGLTRALNARTNAAVQDSLGIPASKLKEIFFDLRRAMKRDGRRLVLLLEDITAFQGLDDALIDVLVADSTTNPDLCDQISVVGLTPNYYGDLKANYTQRITHNISLGVAEDGGIEDVASFRSEVARSKFAATYLAAARAGPSAIETWAAEGTDAFGERAPPPNVCTHCPRQADCHAVFGARDGVGLFPFTERALLNFFRALKINHEGGSWQTPRGMIQGALIPTLSRPHLLDQGTYPSRDIIGHAGLEQGASGVHQIIEQRLSSIQDDNQRNRTRRLIALWGDRNDTTTATRGQTITYAGVPKEIFGRLGLPWFGDDNPVDDTSQEAPAPSSIPSPAKEAHSLTQARTAQHDSRLSQPVETTEGAARSTTLPRVVRQQLKIKPDEHSRLISERDGFRHSRSPLSPDLWNRIATELMRRIDPRRLDTPSVVFNAIFNDNRIKLEGTTSQKNPSYFVLPAEDWVFNALISIAETRQAGFTQKPAGLRDACRRSIGVAIRAIEPLARQHVEKRTPRVDGDALSFPEACTGILTLRAWLRGDVSPDAPLSEQWAAILSGETEPKTDPKRRVDSWDEALRLSHHHHDKLRSQLRASIELTQGRGSGALLDASTGIFAIRRLVQRFKLPDVPPEEDRDGLDAIFDDPIRILNDTPGKISRLPKAEFDRLAASCGAVEAMLRKRSIDAHLDRVDKAITSIDERMAQKQPIVTKWKQALAKHRQETTPECLDKIEACLEQFLDHPAPPDERSKILALVAKQPAALLDGIDVLSKLGEETLKQLANHVRDQIEGHKPNAMTLTQLNDLGGTCERLAAQALSNLGTSP